MAMRENPKPLRFLASALDDLRAFPASARREAGYQLDKVQAGFDPNDWKPMVTVGQGVREIRVRDDSGAFRVIYIAKFGDAVYVLHCFKKTSQATSGPDIELAAKRYSDLVKELRQ
jgi:phage-related protein